MLEAGLVFWRCVHFAALLAFFGTALFPLYTSERTERVSWAGARHMRIMLFLAAGIGAMSGIVVLAYVAAGMVGSWSDLDWHDFASVALETTFGRIWIAHTALAAAVTAMTLSSRVMSSPTAPSVLTSLGGLLLGSLALVGHAQDGSGATRLLHIAADALHLLAAGAWLGGIVALLALLQDSLRADASDDGEVAIRACVRFAGLGTVAVAALVASGLVNTWLLVGTPNALVGTPYGRLLLLKLALFGAMLLLAALNRFKLVPDLLASDRSGRSRAMLSRLRRHIGAEQALGLLVVAVVSALGTMEPAASATRMDRASDRTDLGSSKAAASERPNDPETGNRRLADATQ